MRVALVIGHKAEKPGACNKTYNICEFLYNESLVKLLADELKDVVDIEVVYRDTYRDLPEKVNMLNPDFIVSFHCNAFNTEVSGTETLYYHSSEKGKQIASIFQRNILRALGLPDRGIKGRGSEDRGGYLLRYTNAPCVILEPFFIDNNDDYDTVQNNRDVFILALKLSVMEAAYIF